MSVLRIVKFGNPSLRNKNEEIKELTDDIKKLISDMFETVKDIGVGLAAPQVGINKKLAIIYVNDKENNKTEQYVVINPEIYYFSDEKETDIEGCLSFPDIFEKVERSTKIKVKFKNENFEDVDLELEGFIARVFQHEIDHLNGTVFIDKISPTKRILLKKDLDAIKASELKELGQNETKQRPINKKTNNKKNLKKKKKLKRKK